MALENQQESSDISFELEEVPKKDKSDFFSLSLKELDNQLNNAVTNENYEIAAKIRDEISKRS
jgi:protein-arginine kinase activator protein McsA